VEEVTAMKYAITVEGKAFVIEVEEEQICVDGQVHAADLRRIEPYSLYSLLMDNHSYELFVEEQEGEYGVMLQGKLYTAQVQEAGVQTVSDLTPLVAGDENLVEAPLPGLVLEVLAEAGQERRAGEVLVVLESMKMRTELRCPQDGIVQDVHVAAHDCVAQGQILVTMSPCERVAPIKEYKER
jgi:biotin carboxyl carrier protein